MQATPVDRPRFRQDLVAEPIEDGGARFIDVLDPDSGSLFRFFEVEYSLACAMDGERDVAGIVRWADEELGLKTNPNEVKHVISTLVDYGFLESGAAVSPVAGKPDEFLEKGVVHGTPRAATPAPEVELGHAGTRPSQPDVLPRAPELELGAPGATATARPAAAKAENIALGKPGKVEGVDTDLAAAVPLSTAAVKEAVRQSQIMKAVDVPPELAAELDKPAAKAEPKVEPKPAAVEAKPAVVVEPKVEAKPAAVVEPKVEAKPAAVEPKVADKAAQKPADRAAEKPVEKAADKAKPADKAAQKPAAKAAQKPAATKPAEKPVETKAPPAPSRGVSPVLIAALVLVLLGLGGFALYKFVLAEKPADTQGAVQPTPPPEPEPPAPPPVETAKLAVEQPAAEEIKPVAPGQVATIVANDTAVKEGDAIARLAGYKPVEAQVTSIEKALGKAKDAAASAEKERDAAQTAGNKNGVTSAEKKLTSAQKSITEQEAKLATAKAALDKFLIKAPAAGKVTAVAKANAKVTPTDVIATLTRDSVLVATFKSAGEVATGSHVLLAIKDSEQKLACTVAQSGGDGVKIACPKDAAPEGAEVSYAGLDPNAPATGDAPAGTPGVAPGEPTPGTNPAGTTPETGADPAKADDGSADGDDAKDAADADADAKADKKAEKKATKRRPRPRPAARPAADEPTGSDDAVSGSDKPAEPPPAPAPAPGSGTP